MIPDFWSKGSTAKTHAERYRESMVMPVKLGCISECPVDGISWNERDLKEHTEQNHKAHFIKVIE